MVAHNLLKTGSYHNDKLTFTKVQARIRQHEQFYELQASNQSAVPSVPAFAVTTSHLPGSGPGHVSGNSGGQTTRPAHIPPGCCWNCGIPGHHSRNCPNEPLLATAQTAASSRRPGEDAGNPIAFSGTKHAYHNLWIVDSGCEVHVCNNPDLFTDLAPASQGNLDQIYFGDGQPGIIKGCGTVNLECTVLETLGLAAERSLISLQDCKYIPGAASNLLSVPRATAAGLKVTFTGNRCFFTKNSKVVLTATRYPGGAYVLDREYAAPPPIRALSAWIPQYNHHPGSVGVSDSPVPAAGAPVALAALPAEAPSVLCARTAVLPAEASAGASVLETDNATLIPEPAADPVTATATAVPPSVPEFESAADSEEEILPATLLASNSILPDWTVPDSVPATASAPVQATSSAGAPVLTAAEIPVLIDAPPAPGCSLSVSKSEDIAQEFTVSAHLAHDSLDKGVKLFPGIIFTPG